MAKFNLIIAVLAIAVLPRNIRKVFAEDDFNWSVCRAEFKDKAEKLKIIKDCASKTNFPLKLDADKDTIKAEAKALQDKDYDDGCFSQCIFKEEKLVLADGKIDTAKLAEHFKESKVKPELLKEISSLFEDCVKETEPKYKDEKEMPCKMYSEIHVCIFNKAMANEDKLKEICSK